MFLLIFRTVLVALAGGAMAGLAGASAGFAAPAASGVGFVPPGDQVARVELLTPVAISDLAALEAYLGVTVLQFQHEHPGPYTTLTTGGVVAPGQPIATAITEHLAAEGRWFEGRLTNLESIAAQLTGERRDAVIRTIEDLRAARADLANNGAQIRRVVVFGPPEAIRLLPSKANVISVGAQ